MDPLERLTEAGLLREVEAGGLDWVSDSLGEQALYRALRRRDPALSEESLAAWATLPPTRRLEGALIHAGSACWRAGRPAILGTLLDALHRRGPQLVGLVLVQVAPQGPKAKVAEAAREFGSALRELAARCDSAFQCVRLKHALLTYVVETLEYRRGAGPALHQALVTSLDIAQRLVAQEPDNTAYLRDLSI